MSGPAPVNSHVGPHTRMPDNLFIASYDEATKRHAVLEDDGLTAWLYLHGPSDDPAHTGAVEKACFVYSRVAPIDAKNAEGYRPSPPPIAKGYAAQNAVCDSPEAHSWIIQWSECGRRVLLRRDEEPCCLMEAQTGSKHGHSTSIKAEGPWGSPWDQVKFENTVWRGQQARCTGRRGRAAVKHRTPQARRQ